MADWVLVKRLSLAALLALTLVGCSSDLPTTAASSAPATTTTASPQLSESRRQALHSMLSSHADLAVISIGSPATQIGYWQTLATNLRTVGAELQRYADLADIGFRLENQANRVSGYVACLQAFLAAPAVNSASACYRQMDFRGLGSDIADAQIVLARS